MTADKSDGIIILLGNENTEAGELHPAAKARCEAAVEAATSHPTYDILPTGGFGDFNRSEIAHGALLATHLESLGVPRTRILPPTNSARTLDDALMSRPVVIGRGAKHIVLVTSPAHMPRASYIFRRIFPEIDIELIKSKENSNRKAEREERGKRARTQREWLDVPLYGFQTVEWDFPKEIYDSAAADQKSYDRASYTIVVAQFVILGYPLAENLWHLPILGRFAYGISALLIAVLYILYRRTAGFANTARDVMYLIETQWQRPGFSLNIRRNRRRGIPRWFPPFLQKFGFTAAIDTMTAVMLAIEIGMAILPPG